MNPFFGEPFEFKFPSRIYARSIEFEHDSFELFDAVDADEFDANFGNAIPLSLDQFYDDVPVYALEVNCYGRWDNEAAGWLDDRPKRSEWLEISLDPHEDGFALLFGSIADGGRPVRISAKAASDQAQVKLSAATDLTPHAVKDALITNALPNTASSGVVVLDVGQGSSTALVDQNGHVIAYVDIGAGVLRDSGTWPVAMKGFCLANNPTIVLSHWHYDHFQAANKFPQALNMTWIAPNQPLGPGPQTAMAQSLIKNNNLLIWNKAGQLHRLGFTLERCTGSNQNLNRSGIAVWIKGPNGEDPILLPGDAGYRDIPSLTQNSPQAVWSLVVAHHGGRAIGAPPANPGHFNSRAVFSCGASNSYRHPLPSAISGLTSCGWKTGSPYLEMDERWTKVRAFQLGHVGLTWAGSFPTMICACGCSVQPSQF